MIVMQLFIVFAWNVLAYCTVVVMMYLHSLYGWVIQDSYVIWPNFIGAVLGFVQLGLKLLYKNPGKSSSGVFSLLPTTK